VAGTPILTANTNHGDRDHLVIDTAIQPVEQTAAAILGATENSWPTMLRP
jgi:hypothetical protein